MTAGFVASIVAAGALLVVTALILQVRLVVRYRRRMDLLSRRSTIEAAQVLLGEPDSAIGACLPDITESSHTRSGYRYAVRMMDAELASLNLHLSNRGAVSGALGADDDPRPFDSRAWG